MPIESSITTRGLVLRVEGDLDVTLAGDLLTAVEAAVRRSRRVILDVDRVAFIDCAGLSAVYRASLDAQIAGGSVEVTDGSPTFQRLCAMVRRARSDAAA